MKPSSLPDQTARAEPSFWASFRAFAPHDPVTTYAAGRASPRSRFIGTIENCIEAPPWQNRT